VIYWSEGAQDAFGYTSDEAVGPPDERTDYSCGSKRNWEFSVRCW
jgi:hypothetical protein